MWFSPGSPVNSINKTDRQILLKVALNTIKQTILYFDVSKVKKHGQ
jgi:hypothetical protein